MITPQQNPFRSIQGLSGPWAFQMDPKGVGISKKWFLGLPQKRPIRVPASWNVQFEDTAHYLGDAWYQTRFDLPERFNGQKQYIRFGSVNYRAEVWFNGKRLGHHEGGHLPFEFEVSTHSRPRNNLLIIRVNGSLAPDRVPPGNVSFDPRDAFANSFNPPASFDFFPYCGVQRPVQIIGLPNHFIEDLTVIPEVTGKNGKVRVVVQTQHSPHITCRVALRGFGLEIRLGGPVPGEPFQGRDDCPQRQALGAWSPEPL